MVKVREVVGIPGYTVSVDGEVVIVKNGRVLKGTKRFNGVRTVRLRKDGGFITDIAVHSLIWTTFKGDIPRGSRVAFIDGDKANIHLDNLTLKPLGSMDDGKITHPNQKLKTHEVVNIRSLYRSGKTIAYLANLYGVGNTTVFGIVNFLTYRRVSGGE
jgi:hypothetical protein